MLRVDWVTDPADDRVADAAALLATWERVDLGQEHLTPVDEVAFRVGDHPGGPCGRLALAASPAGETLGAALIVFDVAHPETAGMRWLAVEPAARRRGVGIALVDAIRDAARAAGCHAVTHTAVAGSDASNGFAAAIGAEPGLVMEQNRLDVDDVPTGLLDQWIERATERAAGYSLVCWQNEVPEDFLDRIAKAYEIMNTAPQDPGEEPVRVTPERVRAGHRIHAALGDGFHTTVLHEQSGELVALTELRQVRFRPWHADQGDTCAEPAHRNRGLGRWIKAHNLAWLQREHPDVGEVDTWNAGVNEPMLSINRAMGFRLARTWRNWRLPV